MLAIVAAISLSIFLIWELTDRDPIVNLRLFRHRNFAAGTLVLVLAYAVFFAIALLVPLWLQTTLGYTAIWSGLRPRRSAIAPVLLTFFVGKYGTKFDLRWLASFAFVMMGVTCFMRAEFTTGVDFYHVAMAQLLQGLGVAFFFMPILTILLSDLSAREIAAGSGLATFLRSLGGSFSASITTYFWERGGVTQHATLATHISAYNPQTQTALANSGGDVQQFAAGINGEITQQGRADFLQQHLLRHGLDHPRPDRGDLAGQTTVRAQGRPRCRRRTLTFTIAPLCPCNHVAKVPKSHDAESVNARERGQVLNQRRRCIHAQPGTHECAG